MGVLNATPDSFYAPSRIDPSRFDPQHVRGLAEQMLRDGADILDIGGESTRPGSEPVGIDEELRRVIPVLEALQGIQGSCAEPNIPLNPPSKGDFVREPTPSTQEDIVRESTPVAQGDKSRAEKKSPFEGGFRGMLDGTAISIDTYRAETARRAIALGATMVNDITALRGDPELAGVVADHGVQCVLMHMLGTPSTMQQHPRYDDVVGDIMAFFEERLDFAVEAGIAEDAIWLDPGFGFGKTVEHNLILLRRLREFTRLGRPILVGTSNKSTIGTVLKVEPHDRLEGTAATVAVAICNGASAVRVHDVKPMARVATMCDAILGRNTHDT
jgi:dihydropteroate synthase